MPEFIDTIKDDLTFRITKKLNKLLSDKEVVKKMRDYYFEPVLNEDGEEDLYQFTNPFNKTSFTFKWDSIKGQPILVDDALDEEALKEFHNALAHFVEKQKEIRRKQVKQFLDFYEDDNHLMVIVEIPEEESGDDIDLRATPYELEVSSGKKFHRKVKLVASISPKSGRANFNAEENVLEITFRKSPRLARKRRIRVRKR